MSIYIDNYHQWLDRKLGATEKATEMITEIYVPRAALTQFMTDVRADFRKHVVHSPQGLMRSAGDFRRLIDIALQYGGSFYLPYHRWATRKQVERCYPQFPEFLRLKRTYDPDARFQSDWYRYYTQMFSRP